MTNEENVSAMPDNEADFTASTNRQFDVLESTLDRFLSTADESRAIGEPIVHGDHMIIPTAEVVAGLGFGVGSGGASAKQSEQENGFGSGGGGGGKAFSRPVAVIIAGPNGVEVTPILDTTKIALTALTAFGFMLATISHFMKGPGD
jgi:uncharacterized spore protein YtfJ